MTTRRRLVSAIGFASLAFGALGALGACKDDAKQDAAANAAALKSALPGPSKEGGAPLASPSSSASGSRDDAHVVAFARAARDAATKLASDCSFVTDYQEIHRRYYDACHWKTADLEPMRAAAIAYRQVAPDAGQGAVFAEHVRLFAEWIELIKDRSAPGTLAHYQDLATSWNAYQPSEPIPVDVGKTSKYSSPEDLPPDGGVDGGPRNWQRCSTGACIIVEKQKKP